MDAFKVYIDSSVMLRKLLGAPGVMENWAACERAVASELLHVEIMRTLNRLRLQGDLNAAQHARCVEEQTLWMSAFEQVPIHRAVLQRAAGFFPTPLGTLDAIHLATVLLWRERISEDLTLLTHDRQLALAAQACGVEVRYKP